MTKEERELRREQREHMKRMEAAAKEAGRGPIDVPFLLLVLLLTGVGLIMLLSASFPSAYYESGDPDSLDGVIFPAIGTAIVDGTAPHGMDTLGHRCAYLSCSACSSCMSA